MGVFQDVGKGVASVVKALGNAVKPDPENVAARQDGRNHRSDNRQSGKSYRYGYGGAAQASTAWAAAPGAVADGLGQGLGGGIASGALTSPAGLAIAGVVALLLLAPPRRTS